MEACVGGLSEAKFSSMMREGGMNEFEMKEESLKTPLCCSVLGLREGSIHLWSMLDK